jgi:hypothetical protein
MLEKSDILATLEKYTFLKFFNDFDLFRKVFKKHYKKLSYKWSRFSQERKPWYFLITEWNNK